MPPVLPCLTPAFELLPHTSDNLVFPKWSLPSLEATSLKFPRSIALLEFLAPCGGMPELLDSSIGLLELVAPYGGMPELPSPWEVTLMGRILATDGSLSLQVREIY
jgi:hypothetical protein